MGNTKSTDKSQPPATGGVTAIKRNSDEEKKAVVIPPTKPTPVTAPKVPFSSKPSTNPMIERLKKQQSASQK